MVDLILVSGKIIICTVQVSILGVTVESMMESTFKIKNMVMAFTHGVIKRNTPAGGT